MISCHSAVKIITVLSRLPLLLLYPENVRERILAQTVLHKWVERSEFCTHTHYDDENLEEIIDGFFDRID